MRGTMKAMLMRLGQCYLLGVAAPGSQISCGHVEDVEARLV